MATTEVYSCAAPILTLRFFLSVRVVLGVTCVPGFVVIVDCGLSDDV